MRQQLVRVGDEPDALVDAVAPARELLMRDTGDSVRSIPSKGPVAHTRLIAEATSRLVAHTSDRLRCSRLDNCRDISPDGYVDTDGTGPDDAVGTHDRTSQPWRLWWRVISNGRE
jgi:hypothetical protein